MEDRRSLVRVWSQGQGEFGPRQLRMGASFGERWPPPFVPGLLRGDSCTSLPAASPRRRFSERRSSSHRSLPAVPPDALRWVVYRTPPEEEYLRRLPPEEEAYRRYSPPLRSSPPSRRPSGQSPPVSPLARRSGYRSSASSAYSAYSMDVSRRWSGSFASTEEEEDFPHSLSRRGAFARRGGAWSRTVDVPDELPHRPLRRRTSALHRSLLDRAYQPQVAYGPAPGSRHAPVVVSHSNPHPGEGGPCPARPWRPHQPSPLALQQSPFVSSSIHPLLPPFLPPAANIRPPPSFPALS